MWSMLKSRMLARPHNDASIRDCVKEIEGSVASGNLTPALCSRRHPEMLR